MAFYVTDNYELIANPSEFQKLSEMDRIDLLTNAVEIFETETGKPSPMNKWPVLLYQKAASDKPPANSHEVTVNYGMDLGW